MKWTLALLVLVLSACAPGVFGPPAPQPVSETEAARALAEARKHLGAPYELGARGPRVFDSSSIILHSYRRIIPAMLLRTSRQDANFDAPHGLVHYWNFQKLPLRDLRPGDLVYITDGTQPVTHGALFVRWLEPYRRLEFLHASSRLGAVVLETWPLDRAVRGQTFVAAGRLRVVR